MLVLSIITQEDTKPQLCCLFRRLHIHLSASPCLRAFLEPTPAEKLRQRHRALVAYAQRTRQDVKRLSIAKARDPRVSNLALRGLLDLCDDVYGEVKRRQNHGKAGQDEHREWMHGSERRADRVHAKRKEMQEAMRGSSELQLCRLVGAVLVELEKRVPKLRHEEKREMVEVGDEPPEPVRRHKDLGKLMGIGV